MKTPREGVACPGDLVDLADGREGYAVAIAGPGTLWVLIAPTYQGAGTTEAHAESTLKPFEEV